jgi:hypothetical protein
MTSIQTKEDFLHALTDDPAFKTAVWEALMPEDEAATMPALMAAILDELRESRKTQGLILVSIDRMATDIGHLIGDNLERKMGYALPSELRAGYGVREMSTLVYPAREEAVTPEFLNDLDDARASGAITEDERARVLNTDMIIAELGDNGRRTRFFAAEASNSINNDDLDRAVRTAEILEKIHGLPVIPITFGHQVGDAVRRYNNQEGRRRVRIITLNR